MILSRRRGNDEFQLSRFNRLKIKVNIKKGFADLIIINKDNNQQQKTKLTGIENVYIN